MSDTSAKGPKRLDWARELQAIGQTGLHFSQNHHQRDQYMRIMEIAAEMMESAVGVDKELLLENFLLQPGYATTKVDVRGAVVREGKILLVQERSDQRWAMPGGWADVGEYPSDMVTREVLEESGMKVKPSKVVGVWDANRAGRPMEFYHAYKIVFLCELIEGEPTPSEETMAVEFFDFDALPPLSIHRTNEMHLAEVLAHVRDAGRCAAFD